MRRVAWIGIAGVWLAAACARSATGRSQLLLMPDDQLRAMGEEAFQAIKREERVERDPATNRYVRCVARELLQVVEGAEGVWELVVFDNDSANAFALPGGKIGVFTGLFEVAENENQLAAVIAHEIAHVTQNHSDERVSQALVAEGGLTVASLALGSQGQTHDMVLAALGLGAQFGVLMPFSRAQESEADIVGLTYMARAGFDPRGAVQLWRNMESAGGPSPPEFLSTHPSSETRMHELEERMPDALAVYRQATPSHAAPRCGGDRITLRVVPRASDEPWAAP